MGLVFSMNLKVIGSSSKGNAYILETPTGKLLLECGFSNFRIIKEALNYDLKGVLGCLLTHSHSDHSASICYVCRNGIDIYMTQETADTTGSRGHRLNIIESGKQFKVGDFIVLPFPTEHDCPGAVGYLIQYKPTGEKILFVTDTYFIRNRFGGLDYILVECNYCKDTLDENIANGTIRHEIKNRLLESHFSLEHVKEFLSANDLAKVKKIVLLHLSSANSDAERMVREITGLTGKDTEIAEAGKNIPLELYPF